MMNSPQAPPEGNHPGYPEPRAHALRLWVVLSRAYEAIVAHLHADVARHDLTLMEFGILEVLYHKGPLLLGEVQRRILVSSGGVTYLVDRLERKGLVERRACPGDRRARYAALTPTGEALIREIFPAHAACIESLMSELDATEQATVHRLLRRLGLAAAARPLCAETAGSDRDMHVVRRQNP
jgi:MarR family transcriptional regulator, 2-MHQ and catechol-resistance regulon repressor